MSTATRGEMRLPHLRLAGLPVVFALAALTACHATPPTVPPADAAARAASVDPKPPPADMPSEATPPAPAPAAPAPAPAPPTPSPVYQEHAATANPPPPCVCSQAKPRPKHRAKTRPKARESEPQSVGPAPPPATTVVDAEVGRIDGPLTSILGRNVYSPQGEDLGRVVDLLADPQGRVRVAVIDFGGFLGVGTRRIAVDWPLLHFTPAAKDKPLLLTVTREKLQSAPEYKDSTTPRVLMPPAAAPDAAGAGSKN